MLLFKQEYSGKLHTLTSFGGRGEAANGFHIGGGSSRHHNAGHSFVVKHIQGLTHLLHLLQKGGQGDVLEGVEVQDLSRDVPQVLLCRSKQQVPWGLIWKRDLGKSLNKHKQHSK